MSKWMVFLDGDKKVEVEIQQHGTSLILSNRPFSLELSRYQVARLAAFMRLEQEEIKQAALGQELCEDTVDGWVVPPDETDT